MLPLAFLSILSLGLVSARTVNYTIDDTLGDQLSGRKPVYNVNNDNWGLGPRDCAGCNAAPDPLLAGNGTWHDNSWIPDKSTVVSSVDLSFNGTAIYAYCIISNNVTINPTMNLTFQLDGQPSGNPYTHTPSNQTSNGTFYVYNTLIYANANIPYGEHTLRIINGGGATYSLLLFDYAIYTTDTAMTPKIAATHKLSPGAIVGIVIGILAALLIALLLLIRHTRRSNPKISQFNHQDPRMHDHRLANELQMQQDVNDHRMLEAKDSVPPPEYTQHPSPVLPSINPSRSGFGSSFGPASVAESPSPSSATAVHSYDMKRAVVNY